MHITPQAVGVDTTHFHHNFHHNLYYNHHLHFSLALCHFVQHTHVLTQNKKLFTATSSEELRALVNKGADVDTREKNGITPLMAHTEKREKELVQELIKLRANVDLQNNHGQL